MSELRPPFPPFSEETALRKVRCAENAWNSCDPAVVAMAYAPDCLWRSRSEFIAGRSEIVAFLERKWAAEREYRLIKELWAFRGNRIAVRFAYEWCDSANTWHRAYGNENWEFNDSGLMQRRLACINDLPICEAERTMRWDRNHPRPTNHPELSALSL